MIGEFFNKLERNSRKVHEVEIKTMNHIIYIEV